MNPKKIMSETNYEEITKVLLKLVEECKAQNIILEQRITRLEESQHTQNEGRRSRERAPPRERAIKK